MRIFLLIGLLLPVLTNAETSLWKISKGKNQLYLGGTMHLLSPSDYPLPDEFEQAFRESGALIFETGLEALKSPEVQDSIKNRLIFNGGTHLKNVVKPSTYKALKRYCKGSGLSIDSMNFMKPALVVLTLTLNEMKRIGQTDTGVDQYFLNKAKSTGKSVGGLESVATQVDVLSSMDKGKPDELIISALNELKQSLKHLNELKQAWRIGNLQGLERTGLRGLQSELPEFNKSLLANRNNNWLPKIEAMLSTSERELVLVGALHLVGDDGLLAKLKKHGYAVEYY